MRRLLLLLLTLLFSLSGLAMGGYSDFRQSSDLVNAGISAARGDFVGAGFNLASALPGLGDAFAAGKIATAAVGVAVAKSASHAVSSTAATAAKVEAAAARGVAPEIRALSEANLTGSGRTVLGHYPEYIQKAQRTGASYFDIGDAWNTLTPAQRTSANMHFLDEVAGAGDQIYLSLPKSEIRRGSALADEIQYLTGEKGYQWINQWSLRPSGN